MKRKNIVGNNIRILRIKKGLTQEALALESGLSQGYINQLENGKRLYTQKSLEMIAESLSTPVISFFQGEDVKPENPKKRKGDIADKKHYKKELLSLLSSMPDRIIEHYVTLLKLEKQILKGNQD
jgi:transcriptional regulator with XRE-family HTH domain